MSVMSETVEFDLLPELAALCRDSIEARALMSEALDDGGILASFEIDHAATSRAGHLVVHGEPSDRLRRVMSATRTVNGVSDAV